MEKVMIMVPPNQRLIVDYPMVRMGTDTYNLHYYELVTVKEGETNEPDCSRFTHE